MKSLLLSIVIALPVLIVVVPKAASVRVDGHIQTSTDRAIAELENVQK